MPDHKAFLVVQAGGSAKGAAVEFIDEVRAAAGSALYAAVEDAEILEAGSPEAAIFIAAWDDPAERSRFWEQHGLRAFSRHFGDAPGDACALAAPGVAAGGEPTDPELPCRANSTPVTGSGAALMLVQGRVTEPERILRYRDMIRPLLRDNGGYYLLYTYADRVEVLAGAWREQALIVSIWPARANARAFWDCDTYQHTAIPTRSGAGVFSVHLMPALRGDD